MIHVQYVYLRYMLGKRYLYTSSKYYPEYQMLAKHYTEIDDKGNVVRRWEEKIETTEINGNANN